MSAKLQSVSHRVLALGASAVLVLTTPVAAWWLIGDRLYDRSIVDPDYMVRPPGWNRGTVDAMGLAAVALAVVALVVFVALHRRGRLSGRVLTCTALLMVAGVIAAGGYRTMTAPAIGANIGGGLAVMFGGPAVLGIVVLAILGGVGVLDGSRRRGRRPPVG